MKKNTWNFKDNISDKILLVYSDNITDTFKYCFLLTEIQKKSKKLIFIAQKDIIKLLRLNNFEFEIYPKEIDLESLKYDYFVNISDFNKIEGLTCSNDSHLDVNMQDQRLFKAKNVIDQKKYKIGVKLSNIQSEKFKIFAKIDEANVYNFNSEIYDSKNEIYAWKQYINDIYELALAIKCMHIIVSDDELTINLAGALGKSVFAVYENKKFSNSVYKSITSFVKDSNKDLDSITVLIKHNLEKYRLSLREKYLLACLDQVEKKINEDIYETLNTKSIILDLLISELYKIEYFDEFIKVQNLLKENPEKRIGALGNIATRLHFYTDKQKEAEEIWQMILPDLKQKPEEHPELMFNYSCLCASKGLFSEFFKYYEYRFKKRYNKTTYPDFTKPEWNGETNVSDKTLLIYYEQGYGDSFLFCRYINEIKHLFKKVIFVVQNGIEGVIRDSFKGITVFSKKEFLQADIEFDYHIPLISICKILKINPKNFKEKKWLKADKEKFKNFEKYFSKDRFNIGIFWESSKNDLQRFTTLETLLPLAYIDKVQLYSFHIDKEDFEINYLDKNINIINLGKHFKDFSDTAAAIENCDLIVSTDSSVMNLAGAMGKKTFGLFNKFAEWRWYDLEGEDTGWYKTVKPFHAKELNNFAPEIEKMEIEIKKLVKKKFEN